MAPPEQLVEHFFRHEAGRLTAWVARLLGFDRLEQAEDLVQDVLVQALRAWRLRGVPQNPSAWLYQAARRRALDVLRREQRRQRIEVTLQHEAEATELPATAWLEGELTDSQLRMLFACCHPSLASEAQLAMCLKLLCGLSAAEIAQAFLTSEETIAKRLYRAREKVRAGAIELAVPTGEALSGRLDAVLRVLYLLFNAGYNSSQTDELIRQDLCAEAMRLTLLLSGQPHTAPPRTWALLALMCLQASRFDARTTAEGAIVLLPDQDRRQWHGALITRGMNYLARAAEGDALSEYHLEAAIAYEHCRALSFAETDWRLIRHYYDLLLGLNPSPVVALHRAVAIAHETGPAAGLEAVRAIEGLDQHYLYHAVYGELLAQVGMVDAARDQWLEARLLTPSKAERELLDQKMQAVL